MDIHGYGIGITPQNQKVIFGGFFHTRGYGYLPREDFLLPVYNREIRMFFFRWEHLFSQVSCGERRTGRVNEFKVVVTYLSGITSLLFLSRKNIYLRFLCGSVVKI